MYKMRTETLFCKLIVLFIISVTSWRQSLVKRGRVSVLSLCFYFIGMCCLEGLTSIMLLFRWQIYEIISILRCLFEKKRRKILGKEDTFTRFYVKKQKKSPKTCLIQKIPIVILVPKRRRSDIRFADSIHGWASAHKNSLHFCRKVSLFLSITKTQYVTAVMLIFKVSPTITSLIKGGLPYPKSCKGTV